MRKKNLANEIERALQNATIHSMSAEIMKSAAPDHVKSFVRLATNCSDLSDELKVFCEGFDGSRDIDKIDAANRSIEVIRSMIRDFPGGKPISDADNNQPVPVDGGMDAQRESKILEDAVDTFGMEAQAVVAVEELSELQKALCKWLRYQKHGQGDYDQIITNLREEMADVNIMLGQLHFIFGDVTEEETEKLLRLEKMIEATIHDER